jgi:hypothetical protein
MSQMKTYKMYFYQKIKTYGKRKSSSGDTNVTRRGRSLNNYWDWATGLTTVLQGQGPWQGKEIVYHLHSAQYGPGALSRDVK